MRANIFYIQDLSKVETIVFDPCIVYKETYKNAQFKAKDHL